MQRQGTSEVPCLGHSQRFADFHNSAQVLTNPAYKHSLYGIGYSFALAAGLGGVFQ